MMGLTKEQTNKIVVTEETEVACVNDTPVFADNLQKWAYRRLTTWPALLNTCEDVLDFFTQLDIEQKCISGLSIQLREVITEAREG